jgi:hypothetical protein
MKKGVFWRATRRNNPEDTFLQVIRPVWSYGIQLWGCAGESNIQVIQGYQNKRLKCIVNAPWYVRNNDLHRDLRIEAVTDIIAKFANSHKKKLQDSINMEASRLLKTQTNSVALSPQANYTDRATVQTSKREQYHQTTQTEETV